MGYRILNDRHQNIGGTAFALCRCDCGEEFICDRSKAIHGRRVGCIKCARKHSCAGVTKHGMSGTKLRRCYDNMMQRCYNSNSDNYVGVGGKGIRVCKEWLSDFWAFVSWAKDNGHTDEARLKRIDRTKDFKPRNCQWVIYENRR